MKRAIVLAVAACVLLGGVAWAVLHWFTNQRGSVSISSSGVVSKESQLTQYGQIIAPTGHALGTVVFSTGPLVSGTLSEGGIFSGEGSTFAVTGRGDYGEPKGIIFSGNFRRQIHWTLVSQHGASLVFELRGPIEGTLYNGSVVELSARETIVTTEDQLAEGIGHIQTGEVISYP